MKIDSEPYNQAGVGEIILLTLSVEEAIDLTVGLQRRISIALGMNLDFHNMGNSKWELGTLHEYTYNDRRKVIMFNVQNRHQHELGMEEGFQSIKRVFQEKKEE